MSAEQPSLDLPPVLTAAERWEIEARHDGALPPTMLRALRHGCGGRADRAEARAQSRLYDALARAAVGSRAEQRRVQLDRRKAAAAAADAPAAELGEAATDPDPVARDLLQHRSAGLLWQRLASEDAAEADG